MVYLGTQTTKSASIAPTLVRVFMVTPKEPLLLQFLYCCPWVSGPRRQVFMVHVNRYRVQGVWKGGCLHIQSSHPEVHSQRLDFAETNVPGGLYLAQLGNVTHTLPVRALVLSSWLKPL